MPIGLITYIQINGMDQELQLISICIWENDIREATEAEYEPTGSIITMGMAFYIFSDEKYIREKLSSFSHTEFDVPEITDKISENLAKGKDILNRTKLMKVDLDNSFLNF